MAITSPVGSARSCLKLSPGQFAADADRRELPERDLQPVGPHSPLYSYQWRTNGSSPNANTVPVNGPSFSADCTSAASPCSQRLRGRIRGHGRRSPLAEIDRLRRHQEAHPVRRHDHVARPTARTISAIRAAEVPASRRIMTSPTAISIDGTAPVDPASDGEAPGPASHSTGGANPGGLPPPEEPTCRPSPSAATPRSGSRAAHTCRQHRDPSPPAQASPPQFDPLAHQATAAGPERSYPPHLTGKTPTYPPRCPRNHGSEEGSG